MLAPLSLRQLRTTSRHLPAVDACDFGCEAVLQGDCPWAVSVLKRAVLQVTLMLHARYIHATSSLTCRYCAG